jgi:arabinofuranosyltransferase
MTAPPLPRSGVLLGAALLGAHVAALWPAFVDDSFIFYRYAANWASGHGPVFNVGEYVEGYSSVLWLLMLTVGAVLGVRPEVGGPALGLACALAVVWLIHDAAALLVPGSRIAGPAAAVAVGAPTGFAFYAASGMEAPLFALLLVALALASAKIEQPTARGFALLAGCHALVLLGRPEGFMYSLGLAATMVALDVATRNGRRLRLDGLVLVAAAGSALAVFLIRHAVYGQWFPNTAYAKSFVATQMLDSARRGSSIGAVWSGIEAATAFGLAYAGEHWKWLVIAAAAATLAKLLIDRGQSRLLAAAATLVALNLVAVLVAGGDWMPFRRHLVPAWPLMVLLIVGVVPVIWPAVLVAAAISLGTAHPAINGWTPDLRLLRGETELFVPHREVGARLAELPRTTTVLTSIAGKLPYYAGPRVYVWDLLGLTDRHNARAGDFVRSSGRTDWEYSLGRPFDVFVSNSESEVRALLHHVIRTPAAADRYVFYPQQSWWRQGLVIASTTDPDLVRELTALCGCRPFPLSEQNAVFIARFFLGLPGAPRSRALPPRRPQRGRARSSRGRPRGAAR